MCHLYPYYNVKLLWKFVYINICGFIGRGKFLYETRVLDNTRGEYVTMSNGVFNFNILALVVSEILGGPKFTLAGPVPPCTPPSGFFLYY